MIVFAVARRQKDKDLAVDGVPLQVALQCRAVNFDALDGDWLSAGNYRRNLRLHLGSHRWPHGHKRCHSMNQLLRTHRSPLSKTLSYCTGKRIDNDVNWWNPSGHRENVLSDYTKPLRVWASQINRVI